MNRLRGTLVGVGFVAAALVITLLEPIDIQTNAPFATQVVALDQKVATRSFELTVTAVRFADRLTASEWVGTTDGIWLVADIVYASRIDTTNISATMHIDDRDYLSSARASSVGLESGYAQPGLPWSRSVIFELPQSAPDAPGAAHAVVQFSDTSDPRLDGVIELALNLSQVDHETSLTITNLGGSANDAGGSDDTGVRMTREFG